MSEAFPIGQKVSPASSFNTRTTLLARIPFRYAYDACGEMSFHWSCFFPQFRDGFGGIAFSPTGYMVGYVAQRTFEEKAFLASAKNGDSVTWSIGNTGIPSFGADGSSAFIAFEDRKQHVVINGIRGKSYDQVGRVVFSPDGHRNAYTAQRGEKTFVVIDGREEQAQFDEIDGDSITFSRDGRHVAYIGTDRKEKKQFVVLDGRVSRELPGWIGYRNPSQLVAHEKFPEMAMNRGGTAIAVPIILYHPDAIRADETLGAFIAIIINDGSRLQHLQGKQYERVSPPVFTDETVAYAACDQDCFLVIGTNQLEDHAGIDFDSLAVSQDGRSVAFVAYEEEHGGRQYIVWKGGRSRVYEGGVSNLRFPPGSDLPVYFVHDEEDRTLLMHGNKELDRGDTRFWGQVKFAFSLDGQSMAWAGVTSNGQYAMVVNGKRGRLYDYVWEPHFSPDGKYVGYGARDGHNLWWVVEKAKQSTS
ncbi:MAG: hypothetical protein G01um101438_56 [Parcubacteria group bacterium Gr01-1014_38]|nr:MAG: hypothetical protein G01um101438_56 [Parcubacteria group bacterium Gr01-1014_38]